jgi:peptide/nickel transport system substrate-binding protein
MRKKLGSLLAIAVLAAAACSSSTSTPGAASTAVAGGNMVYALNGDMVLADPSLVSDGNSLLVEAQVVQGLLGLQPGTISTVIPVLAAALPTVSSDGLTYTFKLRTGIKFQDGTDFNADAVVYNYNRWQNYPAGDLQTDAYYYGAVFGGFGSASNIASVTAPDEQTVVIALKTPQSNFELASTLAVFGIQSPAALKAGNADTTPISSNKYAQGQLPQGQDMVGTGPFIFKEWVPGDHITLVKNPSYWDAANAALLNQVTFKPIGDSTATLQALQSGGVDAAFSISPLDVKTAQSSGLTIIDRGASCNQLNLDMNQSVGGTATIYANKKVRLAISEAVNKQSYVNAFYSGLGAVPTGFMPPATIGFKAETLPAYSASQAKSDLAASGVTGSALNIDLYYPSNVVRPYMPDPQGIATAIANDLTAVGFTVNLKTEDWHGGYVSDATAGKLPLYLFGWTCDWAGADNFLYTAWFGYQNGQPNPQFDWANATANTDMLQALQATTPDAANTLWGQVQDLLAQDLPMVPIVNSQPPGAYTSKVHGYVGASNGIEYLNTVWLSQ